MFAYLLLALVAITHLAPDPLQSLTGVDAAVWFYPLRGVEGVALFAALWMRPRLTSGAVAVCWWGAYEELLTATCGGADVFAQTAPGAFQGLCDAHTGVPFYWISLVIAAGLTLWLIAGKDSQKVKV